MLRIEDIIKLWEEDLIVKIKRKPHPEYLKGEFDPQTSEISIYPDQHKTKKELYLTILHEFYHAKDYLIRGSDKDNEELADKEAERTYKNRPEVLEMIKQLWKIY
jgi:hypothetical protein